MTDLMEYTDWERQMWHDWLLQHAEALQISAGPHGDGRFATVGELIRHIFSAEKRYVERLAHQQLSDTSSIPTDKIDALLEFGRQSRKGLRELAERLPKENWDKQVDLQLMNKTFLATPRKIATHVLIHEMRHWAQIATLLRLQGITTGEFHDFVFSPAMGGLPR